MKLGKLTTDELNKNVISLLHKNRPEVLLSSAIGEDCAALDLKDVIVVSSDPITAVVDNEKLGALCVSVCCNDVAANGMGRSSVYELAGRAFDEQLEREKSGIAGQLKADVAEIDGALAQLQKDHERAESELNAEYALELAAEIDKLQQERRKEEERIKKYNNDTARRTLDYKDDRRKAIVKQLEEIYEAEYERAQQEAVAKDYTGAKRESYQDRLQAAIDFYSQYPTAVAGRLIGDNETALERYLGYYLPRLKMELGIDDMGVSDDL